MMAKQADKYTIIRSMTHPSNGHETATYIVMTGTMPSGELAYPSQGAVVALKKSSDAGYQGILPPYIMVPNSLGRFSEAGFLGAQHKAFATGGDPGSADFRVGGLVPPKGMDPARMQERRALLQSVDGFAREVDRVSRYGKMDEYQGKAYDLILGEARQAFDLATESDAMRDRYGRNKFGQSCLLARRLVEKGVPFVTVNMGGWDTHRDNFAALQKLTPNLDQGFSALLEDLAQRGLLDSTIVLWQGEFGRTPKVAMEPPWNGGRHHYAQAFSCVVAGGGFAGGRVLGATDARGEKVKDRPVYPWDLAASVYQLLDIDPRGRLPRPQGCVTYVTPQTGGGQTGGLLKEIMS
jgi:hypothetical protein